MSSTGQASDTSTQLDAAVREIDLDGDGGAHHGRDMVDRDVRPDGQSEQ
jgi:hypothetical protein